MISSRDKQRAAIAEIQELVVALGHRAFVARRVGRDEDLDDPLDLLDARVDPGRAGLPALPVDPEPGLAVVQAADDQIDVGEEPQPEVGDHVAVDRDDRDLGVELARSPRGDLGLGLAAVLPRGTAPTATGSTARPRRGRSGTIVPSPSRARFFMTSLPRAPAPTTRTRAAASRSCRHQEIRRSRLYRSWSSMTSESAGSAFAAGVASRIRGRPWPRTPMVAHPSSRCLAAASRWLSSPMRPATRVDASDALVASLDIDRVVTR